MELPRREFLHLAAGRSSARRVSHSSPLLVLALLVLEERKHGEIFQRNYTTVARALDDTRAAARARHLGAALNVLICSITGFHSACSPRRRRPLRLRRNHCRRLRTATSV